MRVVGRFPSSTRAYFGGRTRGEMVPTTMGTEYIEIVCLMYLGKLEHVIAISESSHNSFLALTDAMLSPGAHAGDA